MTERVKRKTFATLLAVAVGAMGAFAVLSLYVLLFASWARADDGAVLSLDGVPDVLKTAAIVIGAVLFARKTPYLRTLFAPQPATERSKALCMALAVVAGLVCGWLGLAGGADVAARLGNGFLAACAATFGRDFAVRSWRAPRRADVAEVTPGPFAS